MSYKARAKRGRNNCLLLFEGLDGIEFIVFDTETTGKDPKSDYIVQLSAIKYKVVNHIMKEIDTLDIYLKPPFFMEQKVIDVHHITNEFLMDKPDEKEMMDTITDFFGDKPIVVGYNVLFDINFMTAMYNRNKKEFCYIARLDILQMARDLVSPDETKDYKLGTMAALYKVDDELTFHNALMDVRATARLLEVFYNEYKKTESDISLNTLYINFIYWWDGFNVNQKGLYVDTNVGKIWFNPKNKYWCSTAVDLNLYDIQKLEKSILGRTGLTYEEFDKISKAKYEKLKADGKI